MRSVPVGTFVPRSTRVLARGGVPLPEEGARLLLRQRGFSDAKVLALMRLYDETCLALCEGQFLDIWASEHADDMSVDLYIEMVGKKTAALIAASVQAGAMLATDDES